MTITKECKLKNEDINLFKFTVTISIIAFVTWILETNTGIKRLYIMPFVFIIYILLRFVLKKIRKE